MRFSASGLIGMLETDIILTMIPTSLFIPTRSKNAAANTRIAITM